MNTEDKDLVDRVRNLEYRTLVIGWSFISSELLYLFLFWRLFTR